MKHSDSIFLNDGICTSFDPFVRHQLSNLLIMGWTALMTDGTIIYSDYERPGYERFWKRFEKHCNKTCTVPKSIKLHMFGCPSVEFFNEPNGLDGFSVVRGVAREQSMNGDFKDYQSLTVSLLGKNCDHIDVRKFVWPLNEFEEFSGKRVLTKANIQQLIFKNESEKRQKVQEYIDG